MSSTRIEKLVDNAQAAFDRRPAEVEPGLDVEDAALLQLRKACRLLAGAEALYDAAYYTLVIEASFVAIERTIEFRLLERGTMEPDDLPGTHPGVYREAAAVGIVVESMAADLADLWRDHRAKTYYQDGLASAERARAVRRAPARPEWSVASDAEGGTRRAGRAISNHLPNRSQYSASQSLSWWTQKGRGRLDRPPTPKAPQGRGVQRRSRDVERPRAFKELRLRFRVQLTENLRCDRPDPNAVQCRHIVICSGRPKRDAVDEDLVDDLPNDCVPVSIDNRGHRSIEMCIRVICPGSSSPFEQALTDSVDGGILRIASSFPDVVHCRVIGHSSVGGSR